MVSKLTQVDRLENMYLRAEKLFQNQKEIDRESEQKIQALYGAAKNLPSLD